MAKDPKNFEHFGRIWRRLHYGVEQQIVPTWWEMAAKHPEATEEYEHWLEDFYDRVEAQKRKRSD